MSAQQSTDKKRTSASSDVLEASPSVVSSSSTPAAAAAASAAASSLPSIDVLILGMAFVSAEFEAMSVARPGTTVSAVRDRARLLELQRKNPHMKIITLNDNQTAEQCAPAQHVHAKFDQRSAKELKGLFSSSFRYIYCDYFRFPGEYMRGAYGSFMRSMLPKLIELGLMSFDTELIMPNLSGLLKELQHVRLMSSTTSTSLDASAASSSKATTMTTQPCFLHYTSLAAADYPLYAATDRIAPDTLGGFTNLQEIVQLDQLSPFMTIRLTDNERESEKSYLKAIGGAR